MRVSTNRKRETFCISSQLNSSREVDLYSVQGRYHTKLNRLTEVVVHDASTIF